MTTITPELLEEIRERAEKAVQHRSAFGAPYWSVEIAQRTFTPYRLDLDPPTTLALVAALEEAQRERDALKAERWDVKHVDTMNDIASLEIALRSVEAERDAAVKAHNEIAAELTAAQTMAGEEILKSNTLRAENENLRAAIERTCDVRRIINDGSTYARGWNDALFSARAINNAALKEASHG